MLIILLIAAAVFGGGGFSLFGGGSGSDSNTSSIISSLAGNYAGNFTSTSSSSTGWIDKANTGALNTTVAEGAREKRVAIKGGGQDTVTIMVYMCGTDLESRSRMATSDLNEMLKATIADNVNLVVYTGGCTKWNNSTVSSSVNQIYEIRNGKMKCVQKNAGNVSMTDPNTLASFIQWCAQNYPADRNELIFWDHGGGSISGYGYDQKFQRSGSMDLAEISQALNAGGVVFDFVGFDACLMATYETALMLSNYADYMIASEETEPGIGWYYTNWLNSLSANTSMPTIEIGQQIADDFVSQCNKSCPGQKTTLSVVDLAEIGSLTLDKFSAFSSNMGTLISTGDAKSSDFKAVSTARGKSREFAQSSKIDQVDLVHMAKNLGTSEAKTLSDALLSAVKYNKTSSNMTNAYGLSIYFPLQSPSKVDTMTKTYSSIGMDETYSSCIRKFAGMEVSGQVAGGGTQSPLTSLLGGGSSSVSGLGDPSTILNLISTFAGNGGSSGINIGGLDLSSLGFLTGRSITPEEASEYIAQNQFDPSQLTWDTTSGDYKIVLPEDQWELIQHVEKNTFYKDGDGYVDLGYDNLYDFDDDGNLIADVDHTWLAIDKQNVSYYYDTITEDGDNYAIFGHVPCLINDEQAELILVFDNENEDGYIAGVRYDYDAEETETIGKNLSSLSEGDVIDFIASYYNEDGTFEDTYKIGEPLTVSDPDKLTISNTDVGEGEVSITYRFTDIYNQSYWTAPIVN